MTAPFKPILLAPVLLLCSACAHRAPILPAAARPLVAHAGGAVGKLSYTNAKEAFEEAFGRGSRLLEADFSWTSDSELVLLHDFQDGFSSFFREEPRVYSLAEYRALKMAGGLTQMALPDLVEWLSAHPGAFIVTDVKDRNIAALRLIAKRHPEAKARFIPQIYSTGEYWSARNAGFDNLIFTLYRTSESDRRILDFARTERLFAVTMPKARALRSDLAEKLKKAGVYVYAHTVNDSAEFEALKARGVQGIYTDVLYPGAGRASD